MNGAFVGVSRFLAKISMSKSHMGELSSSQNGDVIKLKKEDYLIFAEMNKYPKARYVNSIKNCLTAKVILVKDREKCRTFPNQKPRKRASI